MEFARFCLFVQKSNEAENVSIPKNGNSCENGVNQECA